MYSPTAPCQAAVEALQTCNGDLALACDKIMSAREATWLARRSWASVLVAFRLASKGHVYFFNFLVLKDDECSWNCVFQASRRRETTLL